MTKSLEKEIDNFNKNCSSFHAIKMNQTKKTEIDFNENSNLLGGNNDDLEMNQQFKVSEKKIKYMEEIADYRNQKFRHINEQVHYIQKLSVDINEITKDQHKKIERIDDNVESVLHNAKETFKTLLTTSKAEKDFKENKCCIVLLISIALLFLFLLMIHMNR